jgi:TPR repeat protein
MSSHPSHAEREQALAALAGTTPSSSGQAIANAAPALAPDPFPASSVVSLAPTPSDFSGQTLYLRGGLAINQKRFSDGLSLMKEAAEAGDERAMYLLGLIYAEGDQSAGVRADAAQARGWLERAAKKGLTQAITYLGMKKIAQSVDYGAAYEGVTLLRWADLRGDGQASSILGFAFLLGEGVPKDEALATKYAKTGMERGSAPGKALYATLQAARAKSTAEAQSALQMLRDSASGFPAAHFLTGVLYEGGFGVPKNRELALSAYREAESAGVEAAKVRIAALSNSNSSEAQRPVGRSKPLGNRMEGYPNAGATAAAPVPRPYRPAACDWPGVQQGVGSCQ